MNKPKILIVDDVEANLISLEYLLNEYFDDIEIVKANSGENALKLAFTDNVNFIILDIQMPGMDGFETATFLKSNPKTKHIPIIFLTAAFKADEFQEKGFEIGAVDYLTKPINNHQFINKLKLYIEIFTKNNKLKELNLSLNKTIQNEIKLLKQNQKQQNILQQILDTEQNLMLVTDYSEISFVNSAFLEFFQVKDIAHFEDKYKCLLSLLLDESHSLDIAQVQMHSGQKMGQLFYKAVQMCDEAERVVYLKDTNNVKKAFFINISATQNDSDIHLISLTNITKMRSTQAEVTKQAFHDGLTGIFNRNKFNEILNYEIKKATRYNANVFSCVLIDIDHFKRFNDTYGHLVGDEILVLLTQAIATHIRETDVFARWGGEEFVLLFTDTHIEEATIITEKLRKIVENLQHPVAEKISASFGVTEFHSSDTIETIFKRCDDALYEAKESGRNCVKVR